MKPSDRIAELAASFHNEALEKCKEMVGATQPAWEEFLASGRGQSMLAQLVFNVRTEAIIRYLDEKFPEVPTK